MAQEYERRNKQSSEVVKGYLTALFDFYVSGYYLDLKNERYYAIGQVEEYYDRYNAEDDWTRMDDYIRECINPEDQALITEVSRIDYIRARLKKEKNYSVEVRDHGTGTEKWYRFTVMRCVDDDHAAITFTDVTDQVLQRHKLERLSAELEAQNKQLEENQIRLEESVSEEEAQLEEITALNDELESSQAELEQALTSSAEVTEMLNDVHELLGSATWKIEYDETGTKETKVEFTDGFRRLFGYANEDDYPNSLDFMLSLIYPDDRARMLNDVYKIVKSPDQAAVNISTWYRAYRKDGTLRWFRVQGIVPRREDGTACFTYGVTMDVTDLEESEIAQRETLAAFESLHDALGSANWQMNFDKDGNMTACIWSDRFRKMLGYQSTEDFPDELSSWSDLLHPADKKVTLDAYWRAVNDRTGSTIYSVEYRLLTRTRGYRWFAAHGSLSRYPDGSPKTYYGLFMDINDRVLTAQSQESDLREIAELNVQLQKNQTQLEEAISEQEAQLEEITALNSQRERNQAELEASIAEVEEERAKLSEAFGMIEGLSQEYHTIWVVNKETSRMRLIRSSGKSTIQRAVQMGIDEPAFDPAFDNYIGSCIEPEDRERMHREIAFAEVLRHLSEHPDEIYAVNYLRRDDSGHVGYHQIAFVNADTRDGEKQFVYGFRDIDKIVKEEQRQKDQLQQALNLAEEATARQAAQLEEINALNKELTEQRDNLEKHYDAVRSLSKVYYASYYVDVDKDEHYEILSSDDIKSRYAKFGARGKSQAALNWVCENRIAPEYREAAKAFTDYSTLSERMRDTEIVSIRVQLVSGDWTRMRFIAGSRHEDGTLKSCTFTARNVNDEVVEEEKHNAELQHALTLAQDAAAEQEAQLEEITALNTQLNSNQAELEASVSEQEAQLKEIQQLNAETQTRLDIIQSAMKVYYAAIYIDLEQNSYITLNRMAGLEQLGFAPKGDAQEMLYKICAKTIKPDFVPDMRKFLTLSTVNERLKDTDTVSMQYIGEIAGWSQLDLIAGERGEDGTLKTALLGARDIRAAKEKEQAALNRISEYNDAMANAGYGMWHIILKDGVAPRMQVNDKMAELLGIAGQNLSEEELYNAWYDNIVPDAIPSVQASVGEMMAGNFSENTYQWVHPTKGVIYVRCGGTAGKLDDGTDYISGYHADVTDIVYEEKKQKEELENIKNAALLENEIISSISKMYFAIFRIDLAQNYYEEVASDNSVHLITGHEGNAQEKMNELCALFVTEKYRDDVRAFFDLSTIEERLKDLDTIEYQYHATDGNWHEARFIAKKRNEYGTVTHILYVTRVISAIKQKELEAQEALEKAKDAAEAANRAKSAFLFNMSHDIRTPMNAIIGYANLMKRNPDHMEKWPDYLDKVLASSDFLLGLINNVLEMARIESGKMCLEESVCAADAFIDQIYSVFADEMGKKDLKFTRSVDVQHPYFYTDSVKLKEIILNMLSNAQKYTLPGGSVDLSIKELPTDVDGYAIIQTTVTDTGIGMSEEFLPHIFEEFTREKNSSGNKIQGTGLGMPIVKKLVELMGGKIEVHSKAGEGSAFIVTIPHRIAEKPDGTVKEENVDYSDFADKRILLAEDNDLNAEIAMEILSEYGFQIDRAEDGAVCVDMLSKAEAGTYDIILMDIQMPNLDGYGATRAIRALEDLEKADIPIIAMTANAFEEDKRNAIDAGMDGHVAKPIEIPVLMKTLANVFKDRSAVKNLITGQKPVEDPVAHVKRIYYEMQRSKAVSVLPGGFFAYMAEQPEKLIFANDLCCSIWGCKSFEEFNELVGSSFKGIVHPEDYERVEKEIQHQIAQNDTGMDQVNYRIIRKDGTVSHVNDYGRLIRDRNVGDIFYVFVARTAEGNL